MNTLSQNNQIRQHLESGKSITDLANLVSEMRKFQKNYFKYRDPLSLQAAKKAELVVDAEVARLTGTSTKPQPELLHPKLF